MESQIMGNPVALSGYEFLVVLLMVCVTCAIVGCAVFCACIWSPDGLRRLIGETPFIQNLTVLVVVATAGCLGVGGYIKGELVISLLSGIVGYVLGNSGRPKARGPSTSKATPSPNEQ